MIIPHTKFKLSEATLESIRNAAVNASAEKIVDVARKAVAQNATISDDLPRRLREASQLTRKERDDFLKRSLEKLAEQLGETNKQLEKIIDKLEQSNRRARWYLAYSILSTAVVGILVAWIFWLL